MLSANVLGMMKQDSAGFAAVFVYYFDVVKSAVEAVKYAIIVVLVGFLFYLFYCQNMLSSK